MTQWSGPGGQWQPPDQPFSYQDPAQQAGNWPGNFQPAGQFPLQPMHPPPGSPGMIGGEPVLVVIGDISVTATTVYTPSGSRPLSEVSWNLTDLSVTSQAIPTWAIVCAVVFFLACFLGLLFLLAKENSTSGSVQVTAHGQGFVHTTTIPVSSLAQVGDINARINYVRTLTAASSAPSQPQNWQQGGQQPGQSW
jgi:hypothetical protein